MNRGRFGQRSSVKIPNWRMRSSDISLGATSRRCHMLVDEKYFIVTSFDTFLLPGISQFSVAFDVTEISDINIRG